MIGRSVGLAKCWLCNVSQSLPDLWESKETNLNLSSLFWAVVYERRVSGWSKEAAGDDPQVPTRSVAVMPGPAIGSVTKMAVL